MLRPAPSRLPCRSPTRDDVGDPLAGVNRLAHVQPGRRPHPFGVVHEAAGIGTVQQPVLDKGSRPAGAGGAHIGDPPVAQSQQTARPGVVDAHVDPLAYQRRLRQRVDIAAGAGGGLTAVRLGGTGRGERLLASDHEPRARPGRVLPGGRGPAGTTCQADPDGDDQHGYDQAGRPQAEPGATPGGPRPGSLGGERDVVIELPVWPAAKAALHAPSASRANAPAIPATHQRSRDPARLLRPSVLLWTSACGVS